MKREIKMLAIAIVGMGSVGVAGFANAAAYSKTASTFTTPYSYGSFCYTDAARTAITVGGSTNERVYNVNGVGDSLTVYGQPVDATGKQIAPTVRLAYAVFTQNGVLASSERTYSTTTKYNYIINNSHVTVRSTDGAFLPLATSTVTCNYLDFKP